ncbi:Ankyrin repeat-containing domain protein [Akanthomyces lecanii RCEF 1005]|uniref:Ankyrin repeat-containing domain protein n=1 Tax=Akanthomyces lecanii RCEF 1005 TaxID=1081108 RepID=A0A162J839_CORDF|nr:Ankyrin repeat-containing domain protein [Akanthomyces lecanii RCEF 1005]
MTSTNIAQPGYLTRLPAINDINGIEGALSAGANVNALYKPGKEERKKLLGTGEFNPSGGFMPLHLAAITGSRDAAAYLVEQGANLDAATDDEEVTAFWLAAGLKSPAMMRLLHSKGSDIDHGDEDGITPLHLSSMRGNEEIVECLLDLGASIHAKARFAEDDTALAKAARAGKIEVCRLLLEKGSDINYRNRKGRTPLHIATFEDNQALVEFLLQRGAKVDLTEDRYSRTPLLMAAHRGNISLVRLLHTKGGDINHADRDGQTALHRAALITDLELAQYLLKHNADVHKQDSRGNIALGLAAQAAAMTLWNYDYFSQGAFIHDPQEKASRSKEIYELLLKGGSNKFHENDEGENPEELYQKTLTWCRGI